LSGLLRDRKANLSQSHIVIERISSLLIQASGEGAMTGMLTDKVKAERSQRAKELVSKLAQGVPEFADLDPEAQEKVARVLAFEEVKAKLKKAVDLERIDYRAERDTFISRSSRTGSQRTQKLYAAALGRLEAWCAVQGIAVLELIPAKADDWIAELKGEGRSAATVRLDVSGASAFWSWMERRHPELHNPFRGTRERPAMKSARRLEVPTEEEISQMMSAAEPLLRAAIAVMAKAGLRVGGLPGLSIHGVRLTTLTKGREQSGQVPEEVRREIEKAGLSLRAPFADTTAPRIASRFVYLVGKLYASGKIRTKYSVHDLRHAFAASLYRQTRDIYRVEKALGHASIGVTEAYLKSLGAGA
jgi:site-specific recombinase XerD